MKIFFILIILLMLKSQEVKAFNWIISEDEYPDIQYIKFDCYDSLNCADVSEYLGWGRWIRITTDGGVSWNSIFDNSDLGLRYFCDIAYLNSNSCIAIYNYNFVLKSKGDFVHWDSINLGDNVTLWQIKMFDEKYGCIFTYTKSGSAIFITEDGGNTWNENSLPDSISGSYFLEIAVPQKSNIVVLMRSGGKYKIYITKDNAKSFISSDLPNHTFHLCFKSGNIGYALRSEHITDTITQNVVTEQVILKTYDGGVTWYSIRDTITKGPAILSSVDFLDSLHGIVGDEGGYLSITSDGGKTWIYDSLPNKFKNAGLTYLKYKSLNHIYLQCTISYILRNGNDTMLNVKEPKLQKDDIILYPNPIIDAASIKFDIEQPSNVSLKLTDLLGNQITLIDNQFIDSGSHSVDWDASGVSAGVYFYVLEMGGCVKTGKVVVVK